MRGGWPSIAIAVAIALIGAATPASAQTAVQKTFTPNMTWESIQQLPKIWGVGWGSPESYDATQIVLTALTYPPLKPEYLAKSKAQVQRIMDGKAEFKQAACAPNGMVRSIWYTFAPTFLFQPGNRLLIGAAGEVREVFMDGREHPNNLDSNAAHVKYNGHSIGWWEGSTLVIDTVGVNPGHELYYGVAYGGPNHIVERYQLLNAESMEVTVVVDAPARLAQPWVFKKQYTTRGGGAASRGGGGGSALSSSQCNREDSRQKVDAQGNVILDLTPPPPLK